MLAFRPRNQRMHNKAMIVDGEIAIVGGRNVSNAYFNQSPTFNYLDREVFVCGPLIADLVKSFEAYWDFERSVPLTELRDVKRGLKRGLMLGWAPLDYSYIGFQQKLDDRLENSGRISSEIQALMNEVDRAWLTVDP
ncbi:MAG: hypothetical protein VCD00_17700, partial [Candidatus Hydrogenedentota bacterium]